MRDTEQALSAGGRMTRPAQDQNRQKANTVQAGERNICKKYDVMEILNRFIKERVKNVLNFKKQLRIIIALAVVVVAALSLGLFTNAHENAERKTLTLADFEDVTVGTNHTEIRKILGSPLSSGLWGDTYNLADGTQAVIYYDDFGNVESITIEGVHTSNTEVTDVKNTIRNTQNIDLTPDASDNIVSSLEEYNNAEYPLIAAIPNSNVQMYGVKPSGVVIFKDGVGQFFDWDYMTPRGVLPQMTIADFNNNCVEEICVSLYWGSGTGISIDQLHVLELAKDSSGNDYYIDNQFMERDYIAQLNEILRYEYDRDNKMLTLQIEANEYKLQCEEQFKELGCGYGLAHFDFLNGGIKGTFPVGIVYENTVTAQYDFGTLTVNVIYENGEFTLTEPLFDSELLRLPLSLIDTLEMRNGI